MRCPFCGYSDSKVIDSRPMDDNASIRRRRECLSCRRRFTTFETIGSQPIMVVKKDGSRQVFDRRKVLNGMLRACEKRPVAFGTLDKIATEIETTLQNEMDGPISSSQIGEIVLKRLKNVDEVAYIRFLSVYRQFDDIRSFLEEMNKLLQEH